MKNLREESKTESKKSNRESEISVQKIFGRPLTDVNMTLWLENIQDWSARWCVFKKGEKIMNALKEIIARVVAEVLELIGVFTFVAMFLK